MRKLILSITSLALVFLLSSCSADTSDALLEKAYYSEEEMGIHQSDGLQGIYVRNEEELFSPVIAGFDGYKGQSDKVNLKRYIWFCDPEYLNLIPEVNNQSKLVMVYNSEDAMPKNIYLEKYDFKGYTAGCHMYNKGEKIYLKSKKSLANSYINNQLSYLDDENEYEIISINDQFPIKNIDNNIEMLLGLEFDKYYEFKFFKGTKIMSMTVLADTLVFQNSDAIALDDPYMKTENGYFEVNLPKGLAKGYYFIAGQGLFYYAGD